MIKILALLCQLSAPDNCSWKTVTTSSYADLTMTACLVGMPALADWMRSYPGYRLARWSCQLGERPERSAT